MRLVVLFEAADAPHILAHDLLYATATRIPATQALVLLLACSLCLCCCSCWRDLLALRACFAWTAAHPLAACGAAAGPCCAHHRLQTHYTQRCSAKPELFDAPGPPCSCTLLQGCEGLLRLLVNVDADAISGTPPSPRPPGSAILRLEF